MATALAMFRVLPERIQEVLRAEIENPQEGVEPHVIVRVSLYRLAKRKAPTVLSEVECTVRGPERTAGPWSFCPPASGAQSNEQLSIFGPAEFVSVTAARMLQVAVGFWLGELFAAREAEVPVGQVRAATPYRPRNN